MRLGYRFVTGTLRLFFNLLHNHKVYGLENLPKGPAIIAPNHLSLYDPPIIGASINEELHYLAKQELFEYPLLGTLIRSLNSHPVTGGGQELQSLKLICKLLQSGKKVVIFPEGARSPDGEILPLKTGVSMLALRCNVPIVPVSIQGSFEIWPIHEKWPKLSGNTTCTIGKPIYPEEFSSMKKHEAMDALTEELKQALLGLQKKGQCVVHAL